MKKLRGGTIRIGRARHRDGATLVVGSLGAFVFYRRIGFLLLERAICIGREAATLDHKTLDDAVKNGAVVELIVGILQEVLNGFGRVFRVEFDVNVSHGGGHDHGDFLGLFGGGLFLGHFGLGCFLSESGCGKNTDEGDFEEMIS